MAFDARSLTLDAFGFKRAEPFIYACENIFSVLRDPVHDAITVKDRIGNS